jgi:ABC-type bacteriocin/lantibiotic exporter with double-glycine peptidase domain
MAKKHISYSLKLVPQEHRSGCGVACIAMLCNMSYADALSLLFPNSSSQVCNSDLVSTNLKGNQYLTNESQLRGALTQANLIVSRGWTPISLEELKTLPTSALLCTDDHWMVYDAKQKKILDPWASRCGRYRRQQESLDIDSALQIYMK